MISKFSLWKYLARRLTKKYGVIDPFALLAQLRKFSQPSEVQEPLELLRAGIKFHARGLINAKAIQHNLDWIWPYWVERQFNPHDIAFIPRAFSFSHINLTHRNWTAVGLPDSDVYPIVDPRGLVTPFFSGWSLDFWFFPDNGNPLIPSKTNEARQTLGYDETLSVTTSIANDTLNVKEHVHVTCSSGKLNLNITVHTKIETGGWMYCVVRPYNPEGIQFIENIKYIPRKKHVLVDRENVIELIEKPDRYMFSNYHNGDVIHRLGEKHSTSGTVCDIGMATAAFGYFAAPKQQKTIEISIPLTDDTPRKQNSDGDSLALSDATSSWEKRLSESAQLSVNDKRMEELFQAAKITVTLLSTDTNIVPGPFTYRRFWFRDACLMLNALLCVGMTERAGRILETFPERQTRTGYFHSQEGEWDSNGQVLWIINRFRKLSRSRLSTPIVDAIIKGAFWIDKKRLKARGMPHDGLLPAGFSAEHLGPNDFYYWDNFWSIGGLLSAVEIAETTGDDSLQSRIKSMAADLKLSVEKSIVTIPYTKSGGGIPASPYRRMDAGAIGSLVAEYPLQVYDPFDTRIFRTIDFLMNNCCIDNAFFQDMTHSGINAYLTLAIAQTLLAQNDRRYRLLIDRVAELASATGQWPEAIHPGTNGGCMGDGQHGWAAAEWIMMIRNCFIREQNDKIIVASGIYNEWLTAGPIYFGPTPTPFGTIGVSIQKEKNNTIAVAFDVEKDLNVSGMINVPGYKETPVTDWTKTYILTIKDKVKK